MPQHSAGGLADILLPQREITARHTDHRAHGGADRFATSKMRGATVQELRVSAVEGGRIMEVGSDGLETVWGTFVRFEPFTYLNLDFYIPHPSEEAPGFRTVEVRFTRVAENPTRVVLTQSN